MSGLAELELASIDWSTFRELTGDASKIGPAISRLLNVTTPEEAEDAYWGLENHVVAQGTVYSSAEPTISVLMAAFADPRIHPIKISALDLMEQVLRGMPSYEEVDAGNADLIDRCRDRVREGMWLLIREAVAGGVVQTAALDVIDLVDEARARQVREWLGLEAEPTD